MVKEGQRMKETSQEIGKLDEKCRMREETRDTEKEKCDLQIHSGSDVHLTTFWRMNLTTYNFKHSKGYVQHTIGNYWGLWSVPLQVLEQYQYHRVFVWAGYKSYLHIRIVVNTYVWRAELARLRCKSSILSRINKAQAVLPYRTETIKK